MIERVAMSGVELAEQIAGEIEHSTLAPEAREMLRPCLSHLANSVADWQTTGSFSAPGLVACCATPNAGLMVHSSHWGQGVDELRRDVVLGTLYAAVEAGNPPLVVAAITAVLGPEGRAAVEVAAGEAREFGALPVLVALVAPSGNEINVFLVSAALPPPVPPPSVSVH
jgi:hypothetical protein